MNDADAEKQIARIKRYIDKWMPAGFGWWKIDIQYDRSAGEQSHEDQRSSAGQCSERWEYRMAQITFFLKTVETMDDEELEEVVVHELSHLLLGPVRDYSTEANRQMTEFAVTSVARALISTHQKVIKRSTCGCG